MADSGTSPKQLDDAEIVRRLKASDEEGLRALLLVHGPKVNGWLSRRHGPHVAADALNRAAVVIFMDAATRYSPAKGSLGGWLLRIAHRKALDIRRGESRTKFVQLDFDPKDDPAECDDKDYLEEKAEDPPKRERRKQDLRATVAKLPRVQRIVTECDLLDPTGRATLDVIRKALDNPAATVMSVDVARSKARKFIREEMIRLGHYPDAGRRNHAR